MGFELIEPLRDLFKDEVRRLGLQLGLPDESSGGIRFLAPAWRCAAWASHRERLERLREADAIVVEEI